MTKGFQTAAANMMQKFEKRLASAKNSKEYSEICNEYRKHMKKIGEISSKCFSNRFRK